MADPPRLRHRLFLLTLTVSAALLLSGPGSLPTSADTPTSPRQSPVTLVVQPDAQNGTDTYLREANPTWNFGSDPRLHVGQDPASGLARTLVRFNVSGVPPGSTLLEARLELYRDPGTPGSLEVRRAMAPWTEGAGARGWTRIPILVEETAGVPRVNEPVGLTLAFPPGSVGDPARDVRVWSGASEVPSQVYAYGYTGGDVTSATLYFPASVGAFSTRPYVLTYSANGTAVPAYRTKAWGPTPLWQFGPVGGGSSGASIVDLDRDGRLDVVFGTRDGYLRVLNETGASKWSVRLSTNQALPYTPQVADMDGDGRNDILVFVNDPALVRLNETGAVVWTRPYAVGSILYATPTLVDVNADGVLDVLVGGRFNYVEAVNGANGAVIRTYPSSDWTFTSTLHDIDGDGVPEVFFASDDRTVHAYRMDGTSLWASAPAGTSFIETSVAIGDVDGDGSFEVVTGDDQVNGPTFALRVGTGATVWSRGLPNYREGGLTLADLDGDGTLETLIGVYAGAVHALNGTDGAVRWTLGGGTTQAMSPAVTDLDRDGRPDLVLLDQGTSVRVVNANGAVIHTWTITANNYGLRTLSQKPMGTAAIADLDGDGTLEVVVPTGSGLTAFGTGALARDWRTWGYNWRHTQRAYDGSSPHGAALLSATLGAPETFPGDGASWGHRDGVVPWLASGGDFGAPEATGLVADGWNAWNVTGIARD